MAVREKHKEQGIDVFRSLNLKCLQSDGCTGREEVLDYGRVVDLYDRRRHP